ncbi:MAG: hypothetical protein QOC81_3446 [Thermoanaerobaculia bacterium]|jgi:hypothetical protein|nr:hypothetical protein [Thermoanaerobaculia bacterium]
MPNLDLLDNMIALVVIILLLSLIVQSLQGLFKKLLSMKSKQIEDSLLDLFDSVLREQRTAPAGGGVQRARSLATAKAGVMNLLTIFPSSPNDQAGPRAKELLKAVKGEMSELGRVDYRGQFSLDSLSKGDLLNVIARVAPNTIVDGFTGKLARAMQTIKDIESAVTAVNAAELPGEANALFAQMHEVLAPLQQHYRSLVTPDEKDPNAIAVRAGVVVADILSLQQVLFTGALDLLGKTQRIVAEEKAKAADAAKPPLEAAEKALVAVSAAINDARKALDDAFGGFRSKLTEIESWFDTVMQGFEERYNRGMKSLSTILGAVVVVLLNANVFAIYQSISVNEALRKALVDKGSDIAALQEKIASDERTLARGEPDKTATTTTSATDSTASATGNSATATETSANATDSTASTTDTPPTTASGTTATTDSTATKNAGSTPDAKQKEQSKTQDPQALRNGIAEDKKKLSDMVNTYTSFGFQPLTWHQVYEWFNDLFTCSKTSDGSWLNRRLGDMRTLLGWLVMTMLLSLGAPFWHDALQSLFGVKNLLQKKNEQRNVEQARGAGNPAN